MADPNNIPQEAEQLKRDLQGKESETTTATPNFDKEFEIAQQNKDGAGTQSSDPNPVNRKSADVATGDTSTASTSGHGEPSDPASYRDMAKEVTPS